MIRTTHLLIGTVALLCATRSSPSAGTLGAIDRPAGVTPDRLASADDERRAGSEAWMERSRALSAAVKIEDLHYARVTAAKGRPGVAVVGRAVNESEATLSLLAIHLSLTGPDGATGNVPVIERPDQLPPGASKTFGFVIDPAAAGGFAPLRGAYTKRRPISRDEQRALGRITAYVTYAGE